MLCFFFWLGVYIGFECMLFLKVLFWLEEKFMKFCLFCVKVWGVDELRFEDEDSICKGELYNVFMGSLFL